MPEFLVLITAVGAVLGALVAGLGAFVTWSNRRTAARRSGDGEGRLEGDERP